MKPTDLSWTLLLCSLSCFSSELTLDKYLGEVTKKNSGIKGTLISSEAKDLRKDEGSLFFKPSFFFTGEYVDDQRPTNSPIIQGTQTLKQNFKAGLAQNLRYGTKLSLSYNHNKTQINGTSADILQRSKFYDVGPTLEVTQSLWRNFLGAESEATEKAQNFQNEAQKYNAQFSYKQLVMDAKNAYWRLYYAQKSLKVQEESLERAKKLREWNRSRFRSNLIEESEFLQAESNLKKREMEYQFSQTELRTSLRVLNSLRESEGEVILADSNSSNTDKILTASIPEKRKIREDVLATIASSNASISQSELGSQRNKPSLELYGSYSLNGRNEKYSSASDEAFGTERPMYVVGIRFTTPLDTGALSDFRKSYAQDKIANEMIMKRKTYEVEREWEIFTERFENFKYRLRISRELEQAQEKKLTTEKRLYNQGRTTTFQVLQFEQDFANSQLIKLQSEKDLLAIYNQLMLFAEGEI